LLFPVVSIVCDIFSSRVMLRYRLLVEANVDRPIARRAELTVLFPGASIVPASNTWTCLKTRSENSGAKGARTRIIMVGRVRIDRLSLSG